MLIKNFSFKNLSALIVAAIAPFLSCSTLSLADDSLSFEQCVEQTIEHNPELKASRYSLNVSVFQEKAAHSQYLPQISLNASANRGSSGSSFGSFSGTDLGSSNSQGNSNGTTSGSGSGVNNSYSQNISLNQKIFSGFDTEAKVNQATATVDVNRAILQATKARISFDLKSAFANLLYSQNYIALTQNIIKRRQENLKIVELRFQAGSENKGSFLLSKASLDQANFDALQAKNSAGVSVQTLAKVMGLDQSLELKIKGKVPVSPADKKSDLEKAALDTPDYIQALAQENVSKAALDLARAPFYPSLSFTTTAGRQESDSSSDKNRWQLGFNLSYPLYTGGEDTFQREAALVGFLSASASKQNILKQTIVKLKQAYSSYTEAIELVKVAQSFVDATLARSEIARGKYNNGLLSFEDWDIIENDLITRQKALLQNERDRIVAEATWEQTQGKGVIP